MLPYAGAVAKFCDSLVLLCRPSSACTQQKRITSIQGALCLEHHKVVKPAHLQKLKQHDMVCTALLAPTRSSCNILLHIVFIILLLRLLLILAEDPGMSEAAAVA